MSEILFTEPAELTDDDADTLDQSSDAPRKPQRSERSTNQTTKRAPRSSRRRTESSNADGHSSRFERRRRRGKDPKQPKARHKRLPGGEVRDISSQRVEDDDRPKKKLIQRRERPVLKLAMHRATTAHSCSIFPFGVHEAFGHTGAYLGQDSLGGGGAFFFDAFEAATRFAESDGVTNPCLLYTSPSPRDS